MAITEEKRKEMQEAIVPIKKKLDLLETYTHPKNRRIVRQLIGIREFGPKYILFILARTGLLPRSEFTARLFWGKRIRLPMDRTTTEINYIGALSESTLISFFVKTFNDGDVFYDVGASYGFYTLLATEFIGKGSIHSFEPSPLVFPYLKKNIDPASSVTINNVAVAASKGTISFFHVAKFSTQSTTIARVADEGAVGYEKITVPAITLDDYITSHPVPTIIKLDIEGGEEAALRGAVNCLTKHSPTVIVEIWGGERGKVLSSEAVAFLRGLGYRAYHIDDGGELLLEENADLSSTTLGDNFVFKK